MNKYKNFISLAFVVFAGVATTLQAQLAPLRQIEAQSTDKHTYSAQDVQSTITGQLQAIQSHNLDKAYYAFTTNSFRQSTSKEAFEQFIFQNPVLSKNESTKFKEGVFQNNMVIIQGIYTSTDNNQKIVEYALTMEDGQWKILGIKVFPYAEK